jgi:hypothetical protein
MFLYDLSLNAAEKYNLKRIRKWTICILLLQFLPGVIRKFIDFNNSNSFNSIKLSDLFSKLVSTSPPEIIYNTYGIDFHSMVKNMTILDVSTTVALALPVFFVAHLAINRELYFIPLTFFCLQGFTDTYLNGLVNFPRFGGTFFRYSLVSTIGFLTTAYMIRKSIDQSETHDSDTSL